MSTNWEDRPADPDYPTNRAKFAIASTITIAVLVLFYVLWWAPINDQVNQEREKKASVTVGVTMPEDAKQAEADRSTMKEEVRRSNKEFFLAMSMDPRLPILLDENRRAHANLDRAKDKVAKAKAQAQVHVVNVKMRQLMEDAANRASEPIR